MNVALAAACLSLGMKVSSSRVTGGSRCFWAGVTAVLSGSWSCRVLQGWLCYWRQEALSSSSLGYLARLTTWGDAVAAARSCSGELAFESEIKLFCLPSRQWNLVFVALKVRCQD